METNRTIKTLSMMTREDWRTFSEMADELNRRLVRSMNETLRKYYSKRFDVLGNPKEKS